jgi:hypothetical protein
MPALPDELRPAISVVIPETFEDSRSDIAFLQHWVGQSCEDAFEVIVVAKAGRADFEAAARKRLRPCDQYIAAELTHQMDGYPIGADAARGEWLFITENHVWPDANCLKEVLAFLSDGFTDAAVVNSLSVNRTKIARLEGECFVWQMNETRRKDSEKMQLQLRGFVVRREIFLRHGGLPARYKTYAPAVLRFRMIMAGLRIRWIKKAFVYHVDAPTFRKLATDVRDTAMGECIFANDRRPQCEVLTTIPWRRGCDWGHLWALLRTAARPGRRLHPQRRMRATSSLLLEAFHYVCQGSLPTHLRWVAAYAACQWSRFRLSLTPTNSVNELARFVRMWGRIVDAARLEYAARAAQPALLEPTSAETEMAAMDNVQMAGFHALEAHAGRTFRWSQPLAEIAIAIPAAPHRFTIDTGGLRGDLRALGFALFVNGHRVRPDEIAIDQDLVTFKTPNSWIVAGRPTRIAILTEPLQESRQWGLQRGRRLGLPFFDFSAEMIEMPRSAAAT